MSEELVEQEQPVIMNVSIFSNLPQKLNYLAQAIKNQKDAESKNIYIECFEETRKNDKTKEDELIKIIRLSTDLFLWTELHPYDKLEGDILPYNVAVNLFDFYNIVDNCKDDMISFRIDEENRNLVVSCHYNDTENHEFDELEVDIKINEMGFPKRELPPIELETFHHSIELSHVAIYNIINELNTEHKTDGVHVVVKDRKLFFQSDYNGLQTNIIIKEYAEQIFLKDFNFYMPFYAFNLIAGSGHVSDPYKIKFDIYDEHVVIYTDEYNFAYQIEDVIEPFTIDDSKSKDLLVVEPDNMVACIQLLNRINKPAKVSYATIEKINEQIGEVSVEYEGRYLATARVDMLMLSDDKVVMDSDILESIFTKTKVDGVRIKYDDNGDVYIKYENQLIEKQIKYNKIRFEEYRTNLVKKES